MAPYRIAYCVTTYNGPRLVETIHSIPKNERVLIVDNSQLNKSLSFCWNYAHDRLLCEEGYDYVLVCNDDIVLAKETASLLAEALHIKQFEEERPEMAKMVLLLSAWNLRDFERGTPQDSPKYSAEDFKSDSESNENPFERKFKPRWGTGPDYSCFMFGKSLFQQVGKFDEEIPLYFEDNDSHYRINACGFSALSYAPYWHYGSSTTNSSAEMQEYVAQKYKISEAYYINKHGGGPGYEIR